MTNMEIIIKIPEEVYKAYKTNPSLCMLNADQEFIAKSYLINGLIDGVPLSEGYGRLITETEILRFLKCPKYENCDWKNCSDCNQSRCINLNNVRDLVSIVEEDAESGVSE